MLKCMIMMFATRKHPLSALPPTRLARTFLWPFVIVVGGATAMLMLAAVSVGLDPIVFAGDFLADAAVAVSPIAMRLLAIWAIYTTLYILLARDFRYYAPRANTIADPALGALVSSLLRLGAKVALVMRLQQWQQVQYCLDRAIPSSAWSPGTHPQIE